MTDIKNANNAPRCEHIKFDNEPCRAPALRGHRFCRFHFSTGNVTAGFPIIEDGLSLQVALAQVVRAILDKTLDHKTASLTLYALQIMCANLKRINEERALALKAAKKQDDDDVPGPSLAAILLERLQNLEDEEAAALAPPPPVILSEDAPITPPAVGAPAASASKDLVFPAEKKESALIDKLEACAAPRQSRSPGLQISRSLDLQISDLQISRLPVHVLGT